MTKLNKALRGRRLRMSSRLLMPVKHSVHFRNTILHFRVEFYLESRLAARTRLTVTEQVSKSIQSRILELQEEHRDLDHIVETLTNQSGYDQLLISRLKKRKLALKDQIAKLKSQLIPDLDA